MTSRFLAPLLTQAGYRVAATDLRGHGESSTGWGSYTRTDTAADLFVLIRHLGGPGDPAVIVGHSFAGGAATIAAAQAPELVSAVVEISPFTQVAKISYRACLTDRRYRRGGCGSSAWRSPAAWGYGRATWTSRSPGPLHLARVRDAGGLPRVPVGRRP